MGMKHYKIAMDPALVRWNEMQQNRYKYFRWTPRTAWLSFAYVILVPSIIGVIGYSTDGKWDLRAKRRGDDIREY
ncbi:NADH:ubiquinone oxidoreductase 6.6kD subunit [Apodospora peruviana]|uniref:NADH dehydrogenase [ubiquinone] 1 beta subcomplex subunit 4 n=1 Tax=Apodospora peruviana TaxID=516989 RepID=A0AAE0HXP2_9PEZI|nr:NADH:ubiquinone oxidoreductase 6.6kD subunit [Apodospora peruviana]